MTKTQRNRVIKLVTTLLTHKRNGRIRQESAAYDKLFLYCHDNKLDFTSCLDGATKWLKNNSIAAMMNGIV